MKRRRLAKLFIALLALELIVLLCACVHIHQHGCADVGRCDLCRYLHATRRRWTSAPALAAALAALAAAGGICAPVPVRLRLITPVARRVRLND